MQQINLYLPEFRPKNDIVTARNCCYAIAAMLVFLVTMLVLDVSQLNSLEQEVIALEEQSIKLKDSVDILKKKPKVVPRSGLEQQIAAAKASIENRKGLLEVINSGTFGNKDGFSEKFISLSQEIPKELALRSFAFRNGGYAVRMHGDSNRAEKIPEFIAKLAQQDAFYGARFGQLLLSGNQQSIEFKLSGDGAIEVGSLIDVIEGAE